MADILNDALLGNLVDVNSGDGHSGFVMSSSSCGNLVTTTDADKISGQKSINSSSEEVLNYGTTDDTTGISKSAFNTVASAGLESLLTLREGAISSPVIIATVNQNKTDDYSSTSKRKKIDRSDNERKYIQFLLDKGHLIAGGYYKHDITIATETAILPDLQDYLMLDVIFWDLTLACQRKGLEFNVRCPECGSDLSMIPLGPKKRFMMRKLYCIHQCVILITSMFRCSSAHKHELLGYDPRLLRSFPNLEFPFLLFHRAGTTRQFADYILQSITQGIKLNQIRDILVQNYALTFTKQRNAYVNSCAVYQNAQNDSIENLYFDDYPIDEKLSCPSITLVTQCCLAVFEEKEKVYKCSMDNVTARKYIYLDDTFQIPSNLQTTSKNLSSQQSIAAVRFKRVMFIMNEKKQVMSWQLTKEESCEEIKCVLGLIKNRQSNSSLIGCFTNRCCTWSNDIRNEFHEDFIVKGNMDIVIEKFARHLDLNNDFQRNCYRDFQLVFRYDGDEGLYRTMETAHSVIIQGKLDHFLSSWKNLKFHNGSHILPEPALKEIVAIDEHIARGCYSNIPPMPYIREEPSQQHVYAPSSLPFLDLHQNLQKWMSNARIGVPLAMSMLSIGFHEFNKERGIDVIEPVSSLTNTINELDSVVSDARTSKLNTVIDILHKWLDKEVGVDVNEGIASTTRENNNGHVSRFLMYLMSYKNVSLFVPDILATPRLVPYFLSPLHLISVPYFLKTSEMNTEYFNDVEALRSSINRSRLENCDFTPEGLLFCVISYLKNTSKNQPNHDRSQYFQFLKQEQSLDLGLSISMLLKVCEERRNQQMTFDGLNIFEFIANLFSVVVLVITNLKRFPVLPIYPRAWHPDSPHVLLLLREDTHNPILLELNTTVPPAVQDNLPLHTKLKNFRCRCGRGKAEGNQTPKCVTLEGSRYPSRCLCFRAGESCSTMCDCRACNNPHGARVSKTRQITDNETNKRTRKRYTHEAQNSFKKILSRVPVKTIKDENIDAWNFSEYILFEYALSLIAEDLNNEEDNLLTWSNVPIIIDYILDKYHHLVSVIASITGLEQWLKQKTNVDFEKRYTERQEDVTTNFESLE